MTLRVIREFLLDRTEQKILSFHDLVRRFRDAVRLSVRAFHYYLVRRFHDFDQSFAP